MNRYGLARDIPDQVKLAVRQACGFGCVLCGAPVVQYDHFAPEFKDARAHDPAGIALLCGSCHDRKTRRRTSAAAVAKARAAPFALREGFVREPLEIGAGDVTVMLGEMRVTRCPVILRVRGKDVISIDPPELAGGPHRVNAAFANTSGHPLCRIIDNEIELRVSPWDIEFVGPTPIVKSAPGAIALSLTTIPGEGLRVDQMDIVQAGLRVRIEANGDVVLPGENRFRGGQLAGAGAAIVIQ